MAPTVIRMLVPPKKLATSNGTFNARYKTTGRIAMPPEDAPASVIVSTSCRTGSLRGPAHSGNVATIFFQIIGYLQLIELVATQ